MSFTRSRSRLIMQIYDYNIDYKLPLPSQVSYAFCSRLGNCNGCLLVRISFLPPANEVWGKVIFLHLLVILFTGGKCLTPPGPGTPPGSRHTPGTRYTSQGPGAPPGADRPPWDQVHPPGTRYTPCLEQTHPPPGADTPPRTRYTPQDQEHPPRTRYTPWDQVHPPGPGTPPIEEHAGRYGQHAVGTHPTGMQSCYNMDAQCLSLPYRSRVIVPLLGSASYSDI